MSGRDVLHHVLLALSDQGLAESASRALTTAGNTVLTTTTIDEAKAALRREGFDAALIEASPPATEAALDLVHQTLRQPVHPEIIVLVDRPVVEHAVAVAKAGAFDYISQPASVEQLVHLVEEAAKLAQAKHATAVQRDPFDQFSQAFLVSSVPAVQEMASLARMVASHAEAGALVLGESGAGKSVVCNLIHYLSAQSRAPLISVNLVDEAPEGLEDKLFGSSANAIGIGAAEGDDYGGSVGLLAAASGGTIILNELSELSIDLQPRLLHALETRRIRVTDGDEDREFRARVLATTARDIAALVDERSFHPGLFYRLGNVLIRVPSLRERAEDIPRIAEAMLVQVAIDSSRPSLRLSPEALSMMMGYEWPGNLRELRSHLTRLSLLSPTDIIGPDQLDFLVGRQSSSRLVPPVDSFGRRRSSVPRRPKTSSMPAPKISGVIAAALDDDARAERERIETALQAVGGHREKAAELLGMSRTTLWTRMRLLGIDAGRAGRARLRTG